MTQALAENYVDILPNLSRFGPELERQLGPATTGPATTQGTKAGQTFGQAMGNALHNAGSAIGGEVGNLVDKVGNAFDKIGVKGVALSTKFAAIGGAALGLGFTLQAFASGEQQSQAQLKASIQATGQTWSDYAGAVDVAIKHGENFAINAKTTQDALARLTQDTNNPTAALKYLGLAEDLAAAKHIGLVDAADAVGRAYDGNLRLFKQYGIVVGTNADGTKNLTGALAELAARLSGQAAASVQGFTGTLSVLKTKAEDIVSAFAGPVGNALSNFGGALAAGSIIIDTKFVKSLRTGISEAESFGSKLKVVGGAVGKAGLWGAGIGAGVGILGLFASAHAQAQQKIDDMTAAIQADSGALADNSKALVAKILVESGALPDAHKLGISVATVTAAYLGNTAALDEINTKTAAFASAGQVATGSLHGSSVAYNATADAALRLSSVVGDGASTTDAAIQKYKDMQLVAGALGTSTVDLTGSITTLGSVTSTTEQFSRLSTQAMKEYALAQADAGLKSLLAADDMQRYLGTLDAFLGKSLLIKQTHLAWKDALQSVNDAVKANGKSLSENTAKGRLNQEGLLAIVSTQLQAAEASLKGGAALTAVKPAYEAQIRALEQTAIKAGLSKDQVHTLLDQYAHLPAEITTTFTSPGLVYAINEAQTLSQVLDKISRSQYLSIVGSSPGTRGRPAPAPTPSPTTKTPPAPHGAPGAGVTAPHVAGASFVYHAAPGNSMGTTGEFLNAVAMARIINDWGAV